MTDINEFLDYATAERKDFTDFFWQKWFDRSVEERVAIEDMLIAYDQLVQRLENLVKPRRKGWRICTITTSYNKRMGAFSRKQVVQSGITRYDLAIHLAQKRWPEAKFDDGRATIAGSSDKVSPIQITIE